MAKISTGEINSIRLKEQGSNPSTPASTYGQLFVKSDGLYFINAAGTVTGPLAASAGVNLGADGWAAADAMTYASADAPTFTMTCAGDQTAKYWPGQRIKLTQTTVKYFIITAVAYTSVTTLTLYGGTDYVLANAAITSPYYSSAKAPLGFPLDPIKWTVKVTDTSARVQNTPAQNTRYNLNSNAITIPIGSWNVDFSVCCEAYKSTATYAFIGASLSTANNSSSDAELTGYGGSYATYFDILFKMSKQITLAAKTVYYLNIWTDQTGLASIAEQNDKSNLVIRAVCAYL